MGLFDTIKAQAAGLLTGSAGTETGGPPDHGLVGVVIDAVKGHGLGDLVDKLQTGGLRQAVASWVGPGANLPVSAEQIEGALGQGTLAKLAAHFGLSPEQTSALLAQVLPHAVDQMTPEGTVEGAVVPAADDASSQCDPELSPEPETEPTER